MQPGNAMRWASRKLNNAFQWKAWLTLGVGLALVAPAWARSAPGVARVSLLQGKVSLLQTGSNQWHSAVLNTPLVSGDEIYIPSSGRAEVQFSRYNALQLAGGSELTLADFRGQQLQLQLRRGTLSFNQFSESKINTEIDTPNMSLRPLGHNVTRVDVVDATHTSVTVWQGRTLVWTPQGQVTVSSGHQIQIAGSTHPRYRVIRAPATDAWDRWVHHRDRQLANASDYAYMNSNIYGGGSLNRYGHWLYVPGYGQVWQPMDEAPGWSPYYNGRWVWEPYYGWTWVSYEPWGWAPYHYGRWFFDVSFNDWMWWPGPVYQPAWWAPAYVDFFYAGPGWGDEFGFGDDDCIGWVPLGPGESYYGFSQEHYIPHYGRGFALRDGLRHRIFRPPLTAGNQLRRLKNYRAPGGVIAVNRRGFVNGRVDQLGRRLTRPQLRNVSLVRGTIPVAPRAGSFRLLPGVRRGIGNAARPPLALQRERVFSHRPIRPVRPITVAQLHRTFQLARVHTGWNSIVRPQTGSARGLAPHAVVRNAGPHAIPSFRIQRSRLQTGARGQVNGWRTFNGRGASGPTLRGPAAGRGYERNFPGGRTPIRQMPAGRGFSRGQFPARSGVRAPHGYMNHPTMPAGRPRTNQGGYGRTSSGRGGYGARTPAYAGPRNMGGSPRYSAPRYSAPRYSAPRYSPPPMARSPHYSAPRYSAPHYSAPPMPHYSAPHYSAPHYSAPAPHYSPPPAPHYSAPRGGGRRP